MEYQWIIVGFPREWNFSRPLARVFVQPRLKLTNQSILSLNKYGHVIIELKDTNNNLCSKYKNKKNYKKKNANKQPWSNISASLKRSVWHIQDFHLP